jgi:hypothetical protein
MSHISCLAKVVQGTIAMLKFPGVVHGTTDSLAPCRLGRMIMSLLTHLCKVHVP